MNEELPEYLRLTPDEYLVKYGTVHSCEERLQQVLPLELRERLEKRIRQLKYNED